MSTDVFERVIARTLAELPAPFHPHLENLEVFVEPANADEPDLYGLYEGVPLTERGGDGADLSGPALVFIYRRPLTQDFGHDPAVLQHEIRVTLLHELAHHFGIGEERLAELGWA